MITRTIELDIALTDLDNIEESITDHKRHIQELFTKVFDEDTELQQAITACNNSLDLTYHIPFDEPAQWVCFYSLKDYKEYREYLETYLADNHFMYIDFDNDCLVLPMGPDNIIIGHDGDIFQDYTVIIRNMEYSNRQERNKLIDSYMERTGFFPAVIYQDYYGNMTYINTQEKE